MHRERLDALRDVRRCAGHGHVGGGVVADAVQRTREVGDVVQRAVGSDLQVDDAAGLVVEVVDSGDVAVGVEIRVLDETLGVVPEEEVAAVLGREHVIAIHRATGDGRALPGMRIRVDRVHVARAARRAHAFMDGPAIVGALDDVVDLLPGEVAHVAAIELPGGAVELEPPRIAESVGPDRPELARLAEERVVGGDGSVLVDPQDLPVRTAQVLGERPVAVVAHREVQLAVRPEPDAPADMQQLGRRGGPEQLERAVRADVLEPR